MLIDLAAKKLGVAADTLKVENGVISAADNRKVSYGELAADADLKREATAKAKPKDPATHRIVGQSIARIDIPAKVFGGSAYVQDMRPAGMVHGRIVRPPRYGSTLESVDEGSVKSMPGVIAVVRDGSFLGVIAAARGAGRQGARGAGEGREMEARDRNCRTRPISTRI